MLSIKTALHVWLAQHSPKHLAKSMGVNNSDRSYWSSSSQVLVLYFCSNQIDWWMQSGLDHLEKPVEYWWYYDATVRLDSHPAQTEREGNLSHCLFNTLNFQKHNQELQSKSSCQLTGTSPTHVHTSGS